MKDKITFYYLTNSEYVEISHSNCLSELSTNFLEPFVNRGLIETPLIIEEDFYQALVD